MVRLVAVEHPLVDGLEAALDALRLVDRELVEVRADAVAVGVRVGEHATDQHLVGGDADAGDHVRRGERGLLDLGEEVVRVLVELQDTDLVQRVVGVRPGLGQVERVEAVGLGLLVRHDLDRHRPLREVALLDGLPQVAAVELGVLTRELGGLLVGEELHALLGVVVELHPEALAGLVDPLVGVRAVAVHVAPRLRQAAVAHEVGDLVGRLGGQGPEVPLHVGVAQAVGGEALLRADEVRELHRVAEEEDRGVVADDVEVALGRVVAQREATDVAPGVGGAQLTGDGREAQQRLGGGARLEHGRLRPLRHVLGDREGTERAGALRVRATLDHVLAVEVRQGLDQVHVVQQERAVGADAEGMGVALDRSAAGGTGDGHR